MKLNSIDRVSINVSDIESAVQWYQTSFDCKVNFQNQLEAELEFENIKLLLTLPSKLPMHLSFEKEDAETYGELRERADGKLSCFIGDSSGNHIELIATTNKK